MTIYPANKPPKRVPTQRSAIKRKKRPASEYSRIYHSVERVEFVKAQGCLLAYAVYFGCSGPVDGHHIRGDGTSRKAGFRFIVPLCRVHHDELHDTGRASFQRFYDIDLTDEAACIENLWQAHQQQETP